MIISKIEYSKKLRCAGKGFCGKRFACRSKGGLSQKLAESSRRPDAIFSEFA